MISTHTTLVLGAGASCPYGYPSGARLRQRICDELTSSCPTFDAVQGLGFTGDDIQAFRKAFYRSQITSIDRFLANNRQFWEVGKAAIAAILIQCELEAPLLAERFDVSPKDHWYRYLWNCMDQSWDGFLSNNVRIITFNYDRSLEMFLAIALSSHHGRPFAEALNKVYQLPIIHVYGTLGLIGEQTVAPTRPYSNDLGAAPVRIAAESIRVIPEHRDNEGDKKKIRDMIATAKRICYLGFGYDPLNVERLCLDAMPGDFKQDVLGTAYDFRSGELVAAVKAVKGQEKFFRSLQCEDFLREYPVLR
jgi:hypothetical protein